MVCVDGGEAGKLALLHALDLMKPHDELLVMTVLKPGRTSLDGDDDFMEEYKELVHNSEIKDQIRLDVLAIAGEDPKLVICKEASERHIDYIVLGAQGMGKIIKMGSVCQYVATNSPCPTIVIRDEKGPLGARLKLHKRRQLRDEFEASSHP